MSDLIEAGGRPPKWPVVVSIAALTAACMASPVQHGNFIGAAFVALVGAICAYAFARGK